MKNRKNIFFAIVFVFAVILNVNCSNAKSSSDDDYLMLDKKMRDNRSQVVEQKKQYVVQERVKITEQEKENLRRSLTVREQTNDERQRLIRSAEEKNKEQLAKYQEEQKKIIENEKIKEEALIKERNRLNLEQKQMMAERERIENEKKQIERELNNANRQKQVSAASREADEERQKQIRIREENLKMQQEKIKSDQERLRQVEEKNKREAEEKLRKQEEKFKQEQKKRDEEQQKREEQLIKQQKAREEQILKQQKMKEEQLLKEQDLKERKLREEEAITKARKEEIVAMQKKMDQQNDELKKILLENNSELKKELEKQRKEREVIEREIKQLKSDQTDNFNKLKIINREGVVKSSNEQRVAAKTIDIVNRAENNLNYVERKKKENNDVNIVKGGWSKTDLIEESKIDMRVKKASKKIEGMENIVDANNLKIKNLKDLAYEATQIRNHEIALKYYKEILKINKSDSFTKLSMATTYHMLGQYKQAKPLYIELLDVYPNSEQIVANLLSIVIQETPYEAIYLLPSFAERYQESALIQAQTSVAFAKLNRYDEAIKYLQKAIMLDYENTEYQYNLAILFDLNKNYSDAIKLYTELLKKEPNNYVRNAKIKKRLEKIE